MEAGRDTLQQAWREIHGVAERLRREEETEVATSFHRALRHLQLVELLLFEHGDLDNWLDINFLLDLVEADTVDELQRVIQEIRTTIFDLHGSSPGTTRLRQRLDEAIEAFAGQGLRTTAHFVGPLSVVDAALADHAEAVVREAVSNAVRHSGAHTLTVNVRVEDELSLEVIDDGCGIPADVTASGLNNLRARAEQVGGTLTLNTAPGGGTVLRWVAPLP